LRTAQQKKKADDYNDAGEMFYASRKFKTAENCFTSALKTYRDENMGNSKQAALVISNMGLLYHTTGRYFLAGALPAIDETAGTFGMIKKVWEASLNTCSAYLPGYGNV